MKAYSWKQYKQNHIDSVKDWNNTNTWTKTHQKKAQPSVWAWIKQLVRVYFSKPVKETKVDNLDFANM